MVRTKERTQTMREETKQDILSAGEAGTKYDESAKMIWKNRRSPSYRRRQGLSMAATWENIFVDVVFADVYRFLSIEVFGNYK